MLNSNKTREHTLFVNVSLKRLNHIRKPRKQYALYTHTQNALNSFTIYIRVE